MTFIFNLKKKRCSNQPQSYHFENTSDLFQSFFILHLTDFGGLSVRPLRGSSIGHRSTRMDRHSRHMGILSRHLRADFRLGCSFFGAVFILRRRLSGDHPVTNGGKYLLHPFHGANKRPCLRYNYSTRKTLVKINVDKIKKPLVTLLRVSWVEGGARVVKGRTKIGMTVSKRKCPLNVLFSAEKLSFQYAEKSKDIRKSVRPRMYHISKTRVNSRTMWFPKSDGGRLWGCAWNAAFTHFPKVTRTQTI